MKKRKLSGSPSLAESFVHCVGVRFAVAAPWPEVKTRLWEYARTNGLEGWIRTMGSRGRGLFLTKDGIDSLFDLRGHAYVGFTPAGTRTNVVIKGFEDWFRALDVILRHIKLDAAVRCEGVVHLEVAVMVRHDPALIRLLSGASRRERDNRISLLRCDPQERRLGRRRLHSELEIYRLGDPSRFTPGDDPPGVVKLEARSKVRRHGRFVDYLDTDYADTNHFGWLLAALVAHLTDFVDANRLTPFPRPPSRSGHPDPERLLISKRTERRSDGAADDESMLRQLVADRRRSRASWRFTVPTGTEEPSGIPGGEGRRRKGSKSFIVTRPPAPLPVHCRGFSTGVFRAAVQEAFVQAVVDPSCGVQLELGVRLYVGSGRAAGKAFAFVIRGDQPSLLRGILVAGGRRVPKGVSPGDAIPDSLVGLRVVVQLKRWKSGGVYPDRFEAVPRARGERRPIVQLGDSRRRTRLEAEALRLAGC